MAAMITWADPSMAWATGLDGLLSWLGNLGRRHAGKYLRVVLRARQDVPVGDVEERDRPGLVGAVDVGGYVEGVDEPGVQRGLRLQRSAGIVRDSVVRGVSSVLR